jgi:arylsulfatase A-like enzyme
LAQLSGEADPQVLARARANYVGMLRLVDDQLSRLVAYLEASGRLDETLLIVLADHGDFAGEYGLMRKGPGLPEVLTRIPMLVHGPGVRADAAPSAGHASIADVLPTICDLIERPIPDGVQGRSLKPLLAGPRDDARDFVSAYAEQGQGAPHQETALDAPTFGVRRDAQGRLAIDTVNEVTQSGARQMLRNGQWKLLRAAGHADQLFDLSTDPLELHDLADTADDTLEQLRTELERWRSHLRSPLPVPPA